MSAKYQAYPEYKDSGIEWLGEIPEEWSLCKLKYMARIKNGQDYKHVEVESGFPVIGSGGQFTFASEFMHDKKSVLLGRKGTINKPLFIEEPFWTVDTMYYTEVNKEVPAKYLYYLALTIQFNRYATNTALPSMTQENLNSFEFAVPANNSERTQIANFLDHETAKIDTLIEKQQQLIKLLKEKRQAVISHAVTKGLNPNAPMRDSGVEWLGEVPEHWKTGNLRWFIKIASGEGLSNTEIEGEQEKGSLYRVLGGNGTMGYTKYVNTIDQAFAVGRVGALCGNIHFVDEPCWITDNALKISSWERFEKEYLYFLLTAAKLNDYASRSAQPLITGEQVKALQASMPPEDEQIKIGGYIQSELDTFSELILKSKLGIKLMQERRTALISAAATGKIDVRDWKEKKVNLLESPSA